MTVLGRFYFCLTYTKFAAVFILAWWHHHMFHHKHTSRLLAFFENNSHAINQQRQRWTSAAWLWHLTKI